MFFPSAVKLNVNKTSCVVTGALQDDGVGFFPVKVFIEGPWWSNDGNMCSVQGTYTMGNKPQPCKSVHYLRIRE